MLGYYDIDNDDQNVKINKINNNHYSLIMNVFFLLGNSDTVL